MLLFALILKAFQKFLLLKTFNLKTLCIALNLLTFWTIFFSFVFCTVDGSGENSNSGSDDPFDPFVTLLSDSCGRLVRIRNQTNDKFGKNVPSFSISFYFYFAFLFFSFFLFFAFY